MTNEQTVWRTQKLEDWLSEMGAYPDRYPVTHELHEAQKLEDGIKDVTVAGRIKGIRHMGQILFISLHSIYGDLQLFLKKEEIGPVAFEHFLVFTDLGDLIGAEGSMFTTKAGEKTLRVQTYHLLGKSLHPLPEKWHGLTNIELRYRQRYLDMMMTEETRRRMLDRIRLLRALRTFMEEKGFLEVDTPVLQHTASGALAKPFITHHHSLDMPVYLRIAPETYLKRLIVGGFTKVFEVAKCFRNEGISPQHLQEFTMVEGYAAYWNYEDTMSLMREMVLFMLSETFGTLRFTIGGERIDFGEAWPVLSFRELLLRDTGMDIDAFHTASELLAEIKRRGIALEHENIETLGRGNLIDHLYKKVSRPKLIAPTFLIRHPIDLSPLARANRENPDLTDRFQLVVNGAEIINAYSELVDPLEQRRRLEQQAMLKNGGDLEAMEMDEDYLRAMEYGMPPIAGWGFGIERFLMVITDSPNIKDCVFFPLNRKEEGSARESS